MMRATLIVIILLFAGCAQLASEKNGVLRVSYDEGGLIEVRERRIAQLNRNGTRIEIVGLCVSSCTMYLGADNVCVHPGASLGFHGAINWTETKEHWDARMAAFYPPEIREWFYREAAHLVVVWKTMSGAQAIEMGAPQC